MHSAPGPLDQSQDPDPTEQGDFQPSCPAGPTVQMSPSTLRKLDPVEAGQKLQHLLESMVTPKQSF